MMKRFAVLVLCITQCGNAEAAGHSRKPESPSAGSAVGAVPSPMMTSPPVISSPEPGVTASEFRRSTSLLGGALGLVMNSQGSSLDQSFFASFMGLILDKGLSIFNFGVKPSTNLLQGEIDAYVGGIQVAHQYAGFEGGVARAELMIPAVTMRTALVLLPIGPLAVEVDGGFTLDANLSASLVPNLGFPMSLGDLEAQLVPEAQALGFIEGYVNAIALRGGVGGSVTLIDSNALFDARVSFDGSPPLLTTSGHLDFLYGGFYAFADYFNITQWRWSRFWQNSLGDWKGYCFNFDKNTESSSTCNPLP